ncbi:MAG: hypothetical protein IPK31_14490 [Chitinophagaceae bacterium]|nr:hypothetical protein [Chitinophagaceae bacterium]
MKRNEDHFRGAKRKRYPELDVDQAMATAEHRNEYFDEPIHFQSFNLIKRFLNQLLNLQ